MGRVILRFQGKGPLPAKDVKRIRAVRNTTVLDESSRMLLVQGPKTQLKSLINTMPDWVMSEVRTIPHPDPRPKPQRAPDA